MAVSYNAVVAGQRPWGPKSSANYYSSQAYSFSNTSQTSASSGTTYQDDNAQTFGGWSSRYDYITYVTQSTNSTATGWITETMTVTRTAYYAQGQTGDGLLNDFTASRGEFGLSSSTNIQYGLVGATSRRSFYRTENGVTFSSFASGIASGGYTSATLVQAATEYKDKSTTVTDTREVITRHSIASLSSTETTTAAFTNTIATYDTVTTTSVGYATGSYIIGRNHLATVWHAEKSEYLRLVTATNNTITGLDAILGLPTSAVTVSAAAGSFSFGVARGAASSVRTVSVVSPSYTPTTITKSINSVATVSLGDYAWIGGTQTRDAYLGGVSTATENQVLYTTTYLGYSATTADRVTYTSADYLFLDSVILRTITGIDSNGGSKTYTYQHTHSFYSTFVKIEQGADPGPGYGVSHTFYTSPAHFAAFASPRVSQIRLQRAEGIQAFSALGSTSPQGQSITANSAFYIGANLAYGDVSQVFAHYLTSTTAQTGISSYSFTSGADGVWSVTFASNTSTASTFTATANTVGAASLFTNEIRGAGWGTDFSGVLGGPNAFIGGAEVASFSDYAGWKYTLSNSLGSTSYKTHLGFYASLSLGTSLIAAESFSAILPVGQTTQSPLNFLTLPYQT